MGTGSSVDAWYLKNRNLRLHRYTDVQFADGGKKVFQFVLYLYQTKRRIYMSLGKNLQFLRKMHNGMTQEELAEKMQVSRQTISKWELDLAYPEIEKAMELCQLFSCTMDNLFREDMNICNESYINIRLEDVEEFRYVRYAVISVEPEDDAINHVKNQAACCGVEEPQVIGWDFPVVSQEQINVFHMHGYAAAWILPSGVTLQDKQVEVFVQPKQRYAAITIKEPFRAPFHLIPNGYKTLLAYLKVNGLEQKEEKDVISCYEKVYREDGVEYMDVYIAVR